MFRIILLSVLLLAPPAMAAVVVDQSQISWSEVPTLEVGGSFDGRLAQTFKAGISGRLDHVSLAFSCEPSSQGLFVVEIQTVGADGLPDGFVLGSAGLLSSTLTRVPVTLRDIVIPGVDLLEGTQYAIVMRADKRANCLASEGPAGGGMFSYTRGSAYFDIRPNPPGWVPVGPPEYDLPFYTWMQTYELSSPLYCAFEDASGLPNNWLPNHVPVCGCLSDRTSRANRCWFSLPNFTLWREIEIFGSRPYGKLNWNVLPFDNDFPGVSIEETGIDGDFATFPMQFPAGLTAGKPSRKDSTYKGYATESLITIQFPGPSGMAEAVFRTRFDVPANNGQ